VPKFSVLENYNEEEAPNSLQLEEEIVGQVGWVKPNPNIADDRANKYHLALGDSSPGVDRLKEMVTTPQGDETIRNQAKINTLEARRQAALKLFEEAKDTPEDLYSAMQQANAPRSDVELERNFAESVVTGANSLASSDHLNKAYSSENADAAALLDTLAIERLAQDEIIRKAYQDQNEVVSREGWGEYGYEFGKSLIPGYSWYQQVQNPVGKKLSKILPGNSRQEQYDYINTLSPEETKRVVTDVLAEMNASNKQEALEWVRGLQEGYGSSAAIDNLLSVVDVATAVSPAGIAKKLAGKTADKAIAKVGVKAAVGSEKTIAKATDNVARTHANQVKRILDSVAQPNAKLPEILSGMGKVEEAASLDAAEQLAKKLVPKAEVSMQEGVADLIKKTPSLYNPEAMFVDASRASQKRTAGLIQLAEKNVELFKKQFTDLAQVSRIPESLERFVVEKSAAAYDKAMEQAGLKESVLQVKRIASKDTSLNVSYLEVMHGHKNGTLFKTSKIAENFAKNRLNLPEGSFNVTQEGTAYAIRRRVDIDETDTIVDKTLVALPENQSNTNRNKLFWFLPEPKHLNSYRDSVSQFQAEQRGLAANAVSGSAHYEQAMLEPFRALSKKEMADFQKILVVNRDTMLDPETRGIFYKTVGELDEAYMLHNKRLPTDAETKAYFTYVQKSDMDYIYRSTLQYKSKARQGVTKLEFTAEEGQALAVEGKVIEKLPWNTRYDQGVYYKASKNAAGKFFRLKQAGAMDIIEKGIKDGNLKVVQLYNPKDSALYDAMKVSGQVQFAVIPSVKQGALNIADQVSYRPGGHVKYTDRVMLKQAQLGYDSAKNKIYKGDVVAVSGSNETKLLKEGALLERVRLGLKAKDMNTVQKALDEGLPYTLQQIKKMFKERFSLDIPFSITKDGEATVISKTVNGKNLVDEVGNFEDLSHNPFDLSDAASKDYLGSRDGPMHSIKEAGTPENPLVTLEDAETLNPLQTQIEALSKLSKDRFFNDYKITASESFVREFGDLITLGGRQVPWTDLRRNPYYYIQHGNISGTILDKRTETAMVVSKSIRDLIGQKTVLSEGIDYVTMKLLNKTYERHGEKFTKVINSAGNFAKQDFFQKGRAVAYHTKLGLFNISQMFLQSQTLAVIAARAPTHGPSGALVSSWMRRFDVLAGDTDFIEKSAAQAAKMTPGWSKEEILDSWEHLKRTGYDLVKGDQSLLDDAGDPKVLTTKFGNFLDFASGIFTGTERFVRLSSWNTAYKEYVSKLPKAMIGKLTDTDTKRILDRAKDLNMNMTRDANAFWQNGATSSFSQFWGYSMRVHDFYTGTRATPLEKSRVFMMQAALYGFPIAATPLAPFWPWKDEIRQALAEQGLDINEDGPVDVIMNGVPAALLSLFSGEQFDIGGRYGTDANRLLYNLSKATEGKSALDGILEALGGASGSVIGSIGAPAIDATQHLSYWMGGNENYGRIVVNDLHRIGQAVSSYNNAQKIAMAYNLGVTKTKDGRVLSDDYPVWESVMQFITGVSKQEITDSFLMYNSLKEKQVFEQKIKNDAKYYMRLYYEAEQLGDQTMAQQAASMAKLYLEGGNFTPDQRMDVWKSVQKEIGQPGIVQKNEKDFEKKVLGDN
jgi:hypothetical protein